ncbi:membrane-associated protein, putative, partial [Bodo saltans]
RAGDGCEWVTWVTLTLTLLMIFMLGILRPFLAHYEFGFAVMMATLTAATLALQLAGNEDAADAVVVTQLALGLLMPVVQLLRLVLLWLFVIARDATKAGLSIMDLFVVAVGNGRIRRIPDFVDMLSSSTTPGRNKESGLLHSSTLWPCHDELGSSNSMSCEGRDGDHARRRQLLAEKRLEPLIRLICRSTRMLRKQQDQLRQQRRTKL